MGCTCMLVTPFPWKMSSTSTENRPPSVCVPDECSTPEPPSFWLIMGMRESLDSPRESLLRHWFLPTFVLESPISADFRVPGRVGVLGNCSLEAVKLNLKSHPEIGYRHCLESRDSNARCGRRMECVLRRNRRRNPCM